MKHQPLDIYDDYPYDMKRYLKNYGWHFNKKMCDFAVSMMRKAPDASGRMEKIEPYTVQNVDDLMKARGISLDNAVLYDHVYVANMCKARFLGKSIDDDMHLCKHIKAVIDGHDADDGSVFVEWYARMVHSGIPIEWEDML